MSDPIIAANGLTRRFGDTLAVAELTLEVNRGEVFGFLGHNGAGKTTTVRLLNGVLTPSAGQAPKGISFTGTPKRKGSSAGRAWRRWGARTPRS